jgi:hypothetical protein
MKALQGGNENRSVCCRQVLILFKSIGLAPCLHQYYQQKEAHF